MDSLLSTFLSDPSSFSSIVTLLENVEKLLSNENEDISPTVLKDFFVGEKSIIRLLLNGSLDVKSRIAILDILSLFIQRNAIPWEQISDEMKINLCQCLLSMLKRNDKDARYPSLILSILSLQDLLTVLCRHQLVELFSETLIHLYTSKPSDDSLRTHLKQFFFRLLQTQMDRLVLEPSAPNLRTAMMLVNFGFVLIKLAPDDYTPSLHTLSNHLHFLSTHPKLVDLRQANGQLDLSEVFKFSMTKLLRLLYSVLQSAPSSVLSIITSLLSLSPQIAIEEPTFKLLLELLMHAVRLGASDVSVTAHRPDEKNEIGFSPPTSQHQQQPSVLSLHLLVKLTDLWDQADLPADRLADMMNQLFDLLRVFPSNLEHAEVRLRAWWHFICRLPAELLTDGFRRFVSPFLANMLGRYLSISAPLGDPQLHRYKLSQGNAYEGNASALELSQHVFACFFQSSLVNLKRSDDVPIPRMEDGILAYNSYQLLVALHYWLRLLCGKQMLGTNAEAQSRSTFPAAYLPSQPVDQIWVGSVHRVLEASTRVAQSNTEVALPPSTMRSPSVGMRESESVPLMVLQHAMSTTCHLISPTTIQVVNQRSNSIRTGDPSPTECLNIIEAITDLTMKHPVPDNDRMDLLFDLCVKSMEIGNAWILHCPGTSEPVPADIVSRWCDLTIRLIESDKRLDVASSAIPRSWTIGTGNTTGFGSGGELITLVRQLLIALIPDCVHLAASSNLNTDFGSQDSSLNVWLGQSPIMRYSPEGLRLWSVLADRFTRFILIEQRVCEGDPVSSPDMTTIQATLLAVFWFAGPTPPLQSDSSEVDCHQNANDEKKIQSPLSYLSSKDELAAAKRLATLFAAFHQEACLFTTVATNSWIDHLGYKLATLISSIMPNATNHLNFNLLGRFIRCLAQNAERVHEEMDNKATFNPFSWKSTQERPFGHLTGLVLALRLCLLNSPWFDPPGPSRDTCSPKRRRSTSSMARILTSPPTLAHMTARPGTSQESGLLDDEASVSLSQLTQSQSNLAERIEACGFRVSCGLIEALEAVTILIKDHVRSSDMVGWLVETLTPALLRLAGCCAKAEAAVQAAATELDEPLLITQRRQQAKLALEEIFLSLFQWAKVQPVVFPEQDPASIVRLTPGKRRCKEDAGVANKLPYIAGLLRPALALYGISINPAHRLPVRVPSQSGRGFLSWLVGFWNALQDGCPPSTNKSKSPWDRHVLNEVLSILKDYEQPVVQFLNSLNQSDSNVPAKSKQSAKSNVPSNSASRSTTTSVRKSRIKSEEVEQPNLPTQTTQSCSRLLESSRLKQDDVEGDLSLATLKQELSNSQAFIATLSTLDQSPAANPPTRGRGRRAGRLSLNRRPATATVREELNTTPVRRISMGTTNGDLLSRSAPPGPANRRRGRGRGRLSSSFARSPQPNPQQSPHTPRGGILATALGLQPNMGFGDTRSPWSPAEGSPNPLPSKPLVKRRLFPGIADEIKVGTKSETTSGPSALLGSRRKRCYSDSDPSDTDGTRKPPVLADFEESAQFVFIPPKAESNRKRRRTLTAHQKERFDEQKNDYLPVTYTELDTSQQSLLAGGVGSDSQSGSQSQLSQPSWDQFRAALHERHLLASAVRSDDQPTRTSPEPDSSSFSLPVQTDIPSLALVHADAASSNTSVEAVIPPRFETSESEIPSSPLNCSMHTPTKQSNEESENNVMDSVASPVSTEPIDLNFTPSPSKSPLKVTTHPSEEASLQAHMESRVSVTELSTPPNTPQASTNVVTTEAHVNTTPTSYWSRLSGSRTSIEPNAPIPPALNLNRTSPLIRNIGSSRAQRMLALGLQRAAQQTARQKVSLDLSSSETNSPEHTAPSSPLVSGRRSIQPEQTASPSGIMRNLWSRKKAQRVSFAEQPVVFTFGNSSHSPRNEENDHSTLDRLRTESPNLPSVLKDITGTAINITSDVVTNASESTSKPETTIVTATTVNESPPSQITIPQVSVPTDSMLDTKSDAAEVCSKGMLRALPLITRVDLDASQSSQEGTPVSSKHSDQDPNDVTESDPQRRRRKSNSPQRRVIVVRPAAPLSSGAKVYPKAIMVAPGGRRIKMPKRRRLFTAPDSPPQCPDTGNGSTSVPDSIVPDTESDELSMVPDNHNKTIDSATPNLITLATDSEAIMIADTQDTEGLSQSNDLVNLDIVLTPDDSQMGQERDVATHEECILIESSQGSDFTQSENDCSPAVHEPSEESEAQPNSMQLAMVSTSAPVPTGDTVKSSSSCLASSSISSTDEKVEPAETGSQPLLLCAPNTTQNTSNGASHSEYPPSTEPCLQSTDTGDSEKPAPVDTVDSPVNQDSEINDADQEDVEAQIRDKLAQIAAKLSDLPQARHQAVLMDVLSTFKQIMH